MLLLTNTELITQSMEEYLTVLLDIGESIVAANQSQGAPSNLKVNWRIVQGVTTVMEIKVAAVVAQFERVLNLMHLSLLYKDQQVALAASEFWSGYLNSKLDINDEIRVS